MRPAIIATAALILIGTVSAPAGAWTLWSPPPPAASSPITNDPPTITASDEKQYFTAEFRRVYRGTVAPGINVKVAAEDDLLRQRHYYGTITQSDGKTVDFKPPYVAEYIVRPDLIPLVEDFCRRAIAMDRDYLKQPHDTIRDVDGRLWRLVPAS